ncbi:cysteine--tRNA ligase [Heliorestis acidaminivorans]|uniref:Cysteine--tRNA ligase n=1 Tax=Heliorestis acidaminivorans TaxID=553427 RepID=A0A6I0EY06_9FIRM|nr:cysteine--tRNA ligase [Heliorestis acidaminivorans]KAB2951435.1 cysteine--tRNA ligase [Heliorestis acidaminivorans]
MSLRVYNSLHQKKEAFVPLNAGKVRIYACGPTTYDYIHLGNARPLVVFDTIRRYLDFIGYEVTYVQNFTDIDDKIIKRAQDLGEDPLELAARFIEEYYKDASALNVRKATIHPKVSDHLPEITEMIEKLIQGGQAYEVDGDVYFHIPAFPNYGCLSGRTLEDLQAGARVEVDERKKHAMDFALWKAAKVGEPAWDSPWGKGRPGWHIECSAMALKYLGEQFDIHGGGQDLIFPHHENEIAQSEATVGSGPMAKYWIHNGFITVNAEKMSKSLGNFFTLRQILQKFSGDVIRFYLLATHYRSPIDFDDSKLEGARKSLERLRTSRELLREKLSQEAVGGLTKAGHLHTEALAEQLQKTRIMFFEAMNDDFNTALAISQLFDLARETNSLMHQDTNAYCQETKKLLQQVADTFDEFAQVLGLQLKAEKEQGDSALVEGLLELIFSIRTEARKKKDWATADLIRDGLKDLEIVLEDTPQGTRWKKK